MRLWSIHPDYLDRMGLLGLWREALLAQQVLHGEAEGYKNHSHMQRFYALPREDAMQYMSDYLFYIWQEGQLRGYKMNVENIKDPRNERPILTTPNQLFTVTSGQLALEYQILRAKTRERNIKHFTELDTKFPSHLLWVPKPNPVFTLVHGRKEEWEKFKLE